MLEIFVRTSLNRLQEFVPPRFGGFLGKDTGPHRKTKPFITWSYPWKLTLRKIIISSWIISVRIMKIVRPLKHNQWCEIFRAWPRATWKFYHASTDGRPYFPLPPHPGKKNSNMAAFPYFSRLTNYKNRHTRTAEDPKSFLNNINMSYNLRCIRESRIVGMRQEMEKMRRWGNLELQKYSDRGEH